MNTVSRIHRTFASSRGMAWVVVASAVITSLFAASSANAGGIKDVKVVISSGGFTFGHRHVEHCHPSPRDVWADREFERGQRAGRSDGFNAGYRDALCGGRFDDCVRMDFCHVSQPYENGYRNAFGCAYKDGYEKGRCERLARLERERCERERQRHAHSHSHSHGRSWGSPWRR